MDKQAISVEQRSWLKRFIIISAIIIVLVTAGCVTFALYIDIKTASGNIVFGKIEVSETSNMTLQTTLNGTMPGDSISVGTLTLVKASTSEPFYARVKMSYSIVNAYEDDPTMNEYVKILREHTAYNIITTTQSSGRWSDKSGNYTYFVTPADTNVLKEISLNGAYNITSSIRLPFYELLQAEDYAQYSKQIIFHLAIQVIQSRNMTGYTNAQMKALFSSTFVEDSSENYVL